MRRIICSLVICLLGITQVPVNGCEYLVGNNNQDWKLSGLQITSPDAITRVPIELDVDAEKISSCSKEFTLIDGFLEFFKWTLGLPVTLVRNLFSSSSKDDYCLRILSKGTTKVEQVEAEQVTRTARKQRNTREKVTKIQLKRRKIPEVNVKKVKKKSKYNATVIIAPKMREEELPLFTYNTKAKYKKVEKLLGPSHYSIVIKVPDNPELLLKKAQRCKELYAQARDDGEMFGNLDDIFKFALSPLMAHYGTIINLNKKVVEETLAKEEALAPYESKLYKLFYLTTWASAEFAKVKQTATTNPYVIKDVYEAKEHHVSPNQGYELAKIILGYAFNEVVTSPKTTAEYFIYNIDAQLLPLIRNGKANGTSNTEIVRDIFSIADGLVAKLGTSQSQEVVKFRIYEKCLQVVAKNGLDKSIQKSQLIKVYWKILDLFQGKTFLTAQDLANASLESIKKEAGTMGSVEKKAYLESRLVFFSHLFTFASVRILEVAPEQKQQSQKVQVTIQTMYNDFLLWAKQEVGGDLLPAESTVN